MNKMLFQGINLTPTQVVHKIRISFKESWKAPKEKPLRNLKKPNIDYDKPWGFFDGAWQGTQGICGVGIIIFLCINTLHLIEICCWQRTNN
jgi:hypothetical protein